jgi:serine protease AprX
MSSWKYVVVLVSLIVVMTSSPLVAADVVLAPVSAPVLEEPQVMPLIAPTDGLSRYLWDEAEQPTGEEGIYGGSPVELCYDFRDNNCQQNGTSTDYARYLWDKEETGEPREGLMMPASYAPTPIFAPKNDTSGYMVVARDLILLRSEVQQVRGHIIEEMPAINSAAVLLSAVQAKKLSRSANVLGLAQNGEVQTAALKYSVKGDSELQIEGRKVSWSINNLGKRRLSFASLIVGWPADNGELLSVLLDGKEFDASDIDSMGLVEIDGNLGKKEPATITMVFDEDASDQPDDYEISVAFDEGLKVDYRHNSSLPMQGRRRDTFFPTLIDADLLHTQGVTGKGVTVAIIDTGSWSNKSINLDTKQQPRVKAYYDAIENRTSPPMTDENGHGSHIASVLASSSPTVDLNGDKPGSYHGIAPDSELVIVRAFDGEGRGTYLDVMRGIAYVIAHKQEYNIRVLNLSFSGTPMSHYWQDPLDLAVMAAWRAGIVVVVSAGNTGPDPMTIGVPGNTPYVVTVGAMTMYQNFLVRGRQWKASLSLRSLRRADI